MARHNWVTWTVIDRDFGAERRRLVLSTAINIVFPFKPVSVTSSTRKYYQFYYIFISRDLQNKKTQQLKIKSKDEENGTRRGMFETRIRGIAKTTRKEAKVRGSCLLPQLSPPRSLSLCLSLSPQIGLTPISFFTIL